MEDTAFPDPSAPEASVPQIDKGKARAHPTPKQAAALGGPNALRGVKRYPVRGSGGASPIAGTEPSSNTSEEMVQDTETTPRKDDTPSAAVGQSDVYIPQVHIEDASPPSQRKKYDVPTLVVTGEVNKILILLYLTFTDIYILSATGEMWSLRRSQGGQCNVPFPAKQQAPDIRLSILCKQEATLRAFGLMGGPCSGSDAITWYVS